MNEAEQWSDEVERARSSLQSRFPDLHCLRCGKDKFFMRIWSDDSLVPGLVNEDNDRVLELICENCGYQEKHVVSLLEKSATA
jgi:predicted nucleic-acid-binding Zn-ribbon protein